jgi:predicted house-cleaning noncanonical NTP pyrophosphatase (MazG superfamily)
MREEPMPTFRCNKLGRDKGIESFKAEGITVHYKLLQGKELTQALHHKLVEEVQEVDAAKDREEVIAELADVLEVIDGLCKAHGITALQIAAVKEKKYTERGGFKKGFYVEIIEMADDHPKVRHFRASPEKYPEL